MRTVRRRSLSNVVSQATGERTFSEVTRDIYKLLAAASRGNPLLSLHFVWVVAEPRTKPSSKSRTKPRSKPRAEPSEVQQAEPQAKYREPTFNKLSKEITDAGIKAAMTELIQTSVLQYVWYTGSRRSGDGRDHHIARRSAVRTGN